MAVRTSFTAGEVLAAADLTDTFGAKIDYALAANAQSGTGASAYTFVLADASRLTTATGATAKTFTIPPQASVAWAANSIIRVVNYGAGDLTIAGGAGVTVTNATKMLAQYESAALIRTASNAWTLVPFSGGAGNADFSNTATGTYTSGGINYKFITFTGSGSLTVTKAGFARVLVISGGGSGGFNNGGGGGAGLYLESDVYLPVCTAIVRVGAGGAGGGNTQTRGNDSNLLYYGTIGGGAGGPGNGGAGLSGGSGGGGAAVLGAAGSATLNDGVFLFGNNGAAGQAGGVGGGGGGADGAGGQPNGGAAKSSSITNVATLRAGGGGGVSSTAGQVSGGAGSTGVAATANTGSGGGGGAVSNGQGGSGGSGIVIVRVVV